MVSFELFRLDQLAFNQLRPMLYKDVVSFLMTFFGRYSETADTGSRKRPNRHGDTFSNRSVQSDGLLSVVELCGNSVSSLLTKEP
jgi:hypothetical protein